MLYTHFIGRIGKDAQVIHGKNGDFITMDVATTIFSKGEEKTLWIRVRCKSNFLNRYKYWTKGKLLMFEGSMAEPTVWTDKNGEKHAQLTLNADLVDFLPYGKKKDGTNVTNPSDEEQLPPTPQEVNAVPDAPFEAPTDQESDLPF